MNKTLRELQEEKAQKLDQARSLVLKADRENRDLTNKESIVYNTLVGEIKKLNVQINVEKVSSLTHELVIANAKLIRLQDIANSKRMQRSEFEKLDATDRMAFMRSGGSCFD
ncbi:MAG: hypothetical protein ABSA51_07475 [Anaerolineaceae bacterium]